MNGSISQKIKWELTEESFNRLLSWLDADRERAASIYEEVRNKLIKIFTCRGCSCAEELADETIDRVAKRLPDIADDYIGDPRLYFYGTANNVHREYLRKVAKQAPAPAKEIAFVETEHKAGKYECLEECAMKLPPESRFLVLEYYREDLGPKINHRKDLAKRLGIRLNALRIRACRVRTVLYDCVSQCIQNNEHL